LWRLAQATPLGGRRLTQESASLNLRLASLLGLGFVVSALIPRENPVCLNYLRLRCRVYGSRIIAARHSEVDW
jgi:hypothetical protein